jgi:hypothetical protein
MYTSLVVQEGEGLSGYVAMVKRMHERSGVAEQYKGRVRGSLCLDTGHRALSRGVEQAQVPWIWPDPTVAAAAVRWERVNVLGEHW